MRMKAIFAALLFCTAAALVPSASAQTVRVLATGSSGIWQSIGAAAFNDVAGGFGSAHVYTAKGSKCGSTLTLPCAQMTDSRSSSIAPEVGSVWIVWDSTASNVWAFITVDTIVGNRAYFATPRAHLLLDPCVKTSVGTCPGQNLIASGVIGGATDDASVPDAVFTAINDVAFTALFTELRPEDAAQEQKRVVSPLNTSLSGLGYGTSGGTLIGTKIHSAYTSATANPVAFKITGTDPFPPHKPIPAYEVTPIGAYPVVFIANRQNANGLGAVSGGKFVYTDLSDKKNSIASLSFRLQRLFNGSDCESNLINPSIPAPFVSVPVHEMLREPLSGTMTTAEFTEIRNKANSTNSQEKNVGVPTEFTSANPLSKACANGVGDQTRGIGTGEVLKGTGKGVGGVLNVQDSLAYFFFSFANASPFKLNPTAYGYFTINGVDPLNASYVDGSLPACTAPCPVAPNTSFPNVRNGTYRSWTIVRAVGTPGDPDLSNLVTNAQNDVNSKEPDFVSFVATPDGDTGLQVYRSHFTADGIAGSNVPEAGGDVGGCIFPNPPDNLAIHLNCHQ